MITNIIATLIVVISTNVFSPKQYWHKSNIILCGNSQASYAQQDGSWQDYPANSSGPLWWDNSQPKVRDNPDIRITEVREIKTLSFYFDGKSYAIEHSNALLSTKRENRVEQSQTTQTNGMTITTTVERWIEQ